MVYQVIIHSTASLPAALDYMNFQKCIPVIYMLSDSIVGSDSEPAIVSLLMDEFYRLR